MCRDGIRSAQLELNLAGYDKNVKGSYRYIGKKKKVKENVPFLTKGDRVAGNNQHEEG